MGFFDQALGGLLNQFSGGTQRNALWDLAAAFIQQHPQGLAGLLHQFTSAGFGREASSWVGTGQNLPISGDQLMKVLGQGNLQALGQRLGVSEESASSGLAALLPALIDQLTPDGQVDDNVQLTSALNELRGKLMG
jgi:uncharacterized protein YidB (DUF937 family)